MFLRTTSFHVERGLALFLRMLNTSKIIDTTAQLPAKIATAGMGQYDKEESFFNRINIDKSILPYSAEV